jgi:hypothetical protein
MRERNTCEMVVGRLLEVRLIPGLKRVADVDELIAAMHYWMQSAHDVVLVADWRAQRLMSPETAERVKEMLTANNPKIQRSAMLVTDSSAMTNLQLLRLVREAENPNRQYFDNVADLKAWVGEVLTEVEQVRLNVFLAR